jgi:hypothetical protein
LGAVDGPSGGLQPQPSLGASAVSVPSERTSHVAHCPTGARRMESRAEIYKHKAAECLAKADIAKTRARKAAYLDTARQWTAMVEAIEKEEQQKPKH